jgi:hypothetical protein
MKRPPESCSGSARCSIQPGECVNLKDVRLRVIAAAFFAFAQIFA